jgi:hypothetical protein
MTAAIEREGEGGKAECRGPAKKDGPTLARLLLERNGYRPEIAAPITGDPRSGKPYP